MKTGTIKEDIEKHRLIEEAFNKADGMGLITPENEMRFISSLRTSLIVKTRKGVKTARLSVRDDDAGFAFDKTITL